MRKTKTVVFPVWRDNKERWFTPKDVTGAVSLWAIRQSPYTVPTNLGMAIESLARRLVESLASAGVEECEGMYKLTGSSIENILLCIFKDIPEIMAWNERKNGRPGNSYVSRYSSVDPDDDFICLEALARNAKHTLLGERLLEDD